VVLRLFIDEHGRLLNVEIVEKAGYGFDEAAIEAVKASSFQPARLNGKPVDCKAILPISFRLQ
jgi:protein TonB